MLGKFKWDYKGGRELTISWGELEPENVGDAAAEAAALPPAGVESGAFSFSDSHDFPKEQMQNVELFSRCLSADEVAQIYARSVAECRPEPAEPPPAPKLDKIGLVATLTWAEHRDRAADLGGSLPTRLDLITNAISAGKADAWIPVARNDGQGDWVQIGDKNPHPIYISHLDCFGKPGWGSNNEGAHWRPAYFYVKQA